ncbi:MAG: hypothetical protein ACE5K4_07205 [Candidatus Hydrothermarchaeota archaeon]
MLLSDELIHKFFSGIFILTVSSVFTLCSFNFLNLLLFEPCQESIILKGEYFEKYSLNFNVLMSNPQKNDSSGLLFRYPVVVYKNSTYSVDEIQVKIDADS